MSDQDSNAVNDTVKLNFISNNYPLLKSRDEWEKQQLLKQENSCCQFSDSQANSVAIFLDYIYC